MIIRIVKMTFRPEGVDDFVRLFEKRKSDIRNFPGCSHLDLMRELGDKQVFMTYSYWESEAHLDVYRHSELFKSTWAQTKALFDAKPQAWSLSFVHTDANSTNETTPNTEA